MKIQKISLANIQGKLSRNEMRHIMAGSGDDGDSKCADRSCSVEGVPGECKFWMGDHLSTGCSCFIRNTRYQLCP